MTADNAWKLQPSEVWRDIRFLIDDKRSTSGKWLLGTQAHLPRIALILDRTSRSWLCGMEAAVDDQHDWQLLDRWLHEHQQELTGMPTRRALLRAVHAVAATDPPPFYPPPPRGGTR